MQQLEFLNTKQMNYLDYQTFCIIRSTMCDTRDPQTLGASVSAAFNEELIAVIKITTKARERRKKIYPGLEEISGSTLGVHSIGGQVFHP